MSKEITLKKVDISTEFSENLTEYYKIKNINGDYSVQKLRQWKDDGNIVVYGAEKDGETVGWIAFDPERSTVEEILTKPDLSGNDAAFSMLDTLILKASLISCEIPKKDKDKYNLLLHYGFRPTRNFKSDGYEMVKMDLSTSVYLKKVKGRKPIKEYPKTEDVVIEKVSPARTHEDIKKSLLNVINALGGIEQFVKNGQTVAIKPNVVADHGMIDGKYKGGVVTDVRLMKALIEILLPIASKVVIAEGASINRANTMSLFKLYGYDKLVDLDPEKVSLVDINTDKLVRKPVPGGKRMLSREIPVSLENADVILNVPVMKTHFAAHASLSVKNLQGALPPIEKYMSHFFGLWQNLVNIHHLVKPKLIIIDGLTAQEDFGPVTGSPKEMNLILGGTNPVAVDSVAMRIMGLNPSDSPPVQVAYMQGLGPMEQEKINVIGPSIDEVMSPFVKPVLDLSSGRDFKIHYHSACQGCSGYLHYGLFKLRRPDPKNPDELLIDRPFDKKVNIFLGPFPDEEPNPDEKNIFMGICQQHNAEMGQHMPGCPPHAEVILKSIYSLYPDVQRPQYADVSAEDKLEGMLKEILEKG